MMDNQGVEMSSRQLCDDGRKSDDETRDSELSGLANNVIGKDGTQLLNIFPVEVWKLIFKQVKDSSDFENLANSSLSFRHMLIEERVLFLFPKLFHLLDLKFHHSESRIEQHQNTFNHVEPDNNRLYMECLSCHRWTLKWWYTATLRFSFVCVSRCNAVDQLLQGLPLPYKWDDEAKEGFSCATRKTSVTFVDHRPQDVENFLEHFKESYPNGTGRSPFIGRKVVLTLDRPDRNNIPSEWSRLLSEHGHRISYSDISIQPGSHLSLYQHILELLELMPNLKVLHIETDDEWIDELELEEYNSELEVSMELHPLPILGRLQVLSTKSIPPPVFNALIRKYHQVPNLRMQPLEYLVYEEIDMSPLSNLKHIDVQLYSQTVLQMVANQLSSWPFLSHLGLDFQKCAFIKWSIIFTVLEEKWTGTVPSMVLKLPQAKEKNDRDWISENCSKLRLKLPGITKLNVMIPNPSSFDFILPLIESLQLLHITFFYYLGRGNHEKWKQRELMKLALESGEVIRLPNYCNRMSPANIWKIFLELKRIVILETVGSVCLEDMMDPEDIRTSWNYWKPYNLELTVATQKESEQN